MGLLTWHYARPALPGQGRGRNLRGIWHKVLQPLFIVGPEPGPDQRKHKHGRYYPLIIKIMKITLRVFNNVDMLYVISCLKILLALTSYC